jgi:protein-tyrosine phosphatase
VAGGATLDFYLGHLDPGSPVLPLALQILAVVLTRPAVVHCAAGKDRAGLVVALVLSIVGVRDEAIVADYMVTAQNMPRINERFQSWPRYREHMAAADPELYRVQEHAIQAFLRELDQRHGGARAWATRRGVPASLLDMLTDRLLEG